MAKIVDGIARSTIRFAVESKEHHKKAYEIVESKKKKNEFMIQAIIEKEERSNLSEQLRKIVREELTHISFSPQIPQDNKVEQQPVTNEPSQAQEEEIPPDAIDFLNNLGNNKST